MNLVLLDDLDIIQHTHGPANIYLFKVNNANTRIIVKSEGTRATSLMSFCVFINFLYCTDFIYCSGVSIVDFEYGNTSCAEFNSKKLPAIHRRRAPLVHKSTAFLQTGSTANFP